ncbi:glycosyltransferase family 2 protein [Anaeromyxobacter paludicola]|uniref:Glycosyltransferase 2-like domain-containing protein n=1 Tax=Anaeromyxobacter paludicola TaxID=2918171 RepID=A0ABN6N1T6_9BACT|nr:glycosyltransferase family 2 protein [Anaeromyxobacter paludicola]BDG07175.1 hypothetical protein AMPC_02880 [Anaeromyxobacter paludicola]
MNLERLLDRAFWAQDRLAYSLRRRGFAGTARFLAGRALRAERRAPPPLATQYPGWLEARAPRPADLARALDRLAWRPLVSIVSDAAPGSPLAQSLAAQGYPRYELAPSLAAAAGEVVGALRAGDRVRPGALLRLVARLEEGLELGYADHDEPGPAGRVPVLKPDWSPELREAVDYVGRAWLARRSFLAALGGDPTRSPGCRAPAGARIGRVPEVLFQLEDRSGPAAPGARPPELRGDPLVSIVIPTRDRVGLLRGAVASLEARTPRPRFELVLVDNGSADPEALRYLAELSGRGHRVVRRDAPFNWSELSNLGARAGRGELLLFLNNDVEALEPGWLAALAARAQDPEVGPVGARLLYPDGTVQHAGVIVGQGGTAGHPFRGALPDAPGPLFGPGVARDWSAVTGACLLVRREVFEALGGFDERLPVAYNDVDFCLRARERGLRVAYEPAATLLHREQASRARVDPWRDGVRFRRRWRAFLEAGDPYGHPGLDLTWPEGELVAQGAEDGGRDRPHPRRARGRMEGGEG